jgi:hypothetical protein
MDSRRGQVQQLKAIGEVQLDCQSLWNLSLVLKEIAETAQTRLSHQDTELENKDDEALAGGGKEASPYESE